MKSTGRRPNVPSPRRGHAGVVDICGIGGAGPDVGVGATGLDVGVGAIEVVVGPDNTMSAGVEVGREVVDVAVAGFVAGVEVAAMVGGNPVAGSISTGTTVSTGGLTPAGFSSSTAQPPSDRASINRTGAMSARRFSRVDSAPHAGRSAGRLTEIESLMSACRR